MPEVTLQLRTHHKSQLEVLRNLSRFNVLCCGRRWGKTTIAEDILLGPDETMNGALNGYPVAYFAPTYKMMGDFWREMKIVCFPITKSVSEQEKRINIIGGGWIDFWSLDSPDGVRGRKYKRVVIDEAAVIRELKYAWNEVIRPLLSDMQGDGFFLSTPKGQNNYFYELFEKQNKFSNWKSWQLPTNLNPYIKQEEIDAAEAELDPVSFAQEYLASFVTNQYDQWAYCFDRSKHVAETKLVKGREVYLSFDFNRNPITCGVFQFIGDTIVGIEQIKLQNSNIYALCDYIVAKYGGCLFLVTGDATGKAGSAMMQDNINYYTIIRQKLHLSSGQLRVPTVNPKLKENRVLVNSVLHNMNVQLDPVNCKHLIFDLVHARVLPDGNLDKTDRNDATKQLDALDCFRYYLNTFQRNSLKLG